MNLSRHLLKINKRLLPVKIHYFLFMTALSSFLPFRSVFAKQLGISATAVGLIFSAIPFVKIITNPLFGYILDYFKRFRLTISIIMIIAAVSHIALILLPPAKSDSIVKYEKNLEVNIEHSCVMNSEEKEQIINVYSKWSGFKHVENMFICDINCTENIKQDKDDCIKVPNFYFKLLINSTSCKMSIKLNDIIYNGKSMEIEGENVNLQGYVSMHSRISYERRAPKELNSYLGVTSFMRNQQSNESLTTLKVFKEQLKTSSTVIYPNKNFNCYGEQHFKIKFEGENCRCKSISKCTTKQCSPVVFESEVKSKITVDSEFLTVQFWGLFMLFSISSASTTAVLFMVDTVCYEILEDKRDKFGEQRLWATIGWGVGALAGGYLNQILSFGDDVNYAPSIFFLFILILFDLIPIHHLRVSNLVFSSHIWKDVCSLLSNADIVFNMIVVYSIGALSGFVWNYQFWFMEEIGASQVLLGLSQTFECLVAEVPCFLASGWIIKRIGYAHCNNITFLCFGARYLCFAFMYDPWMTLPVGLFHGPTFGLFFASMTAYAKQEAPRGAEATVQSLMYLLFEGIGVASGTFLGGVGIDLIGSRATFMYAAVISFILLFINFAATSLCFRTKTKI